VPNSSEEVVGRSLSRTEQIWKDSLEKEIAGSKETLVRVPSNYICTKISQNSVVKEINVYMKCSQNDIFRGQVEGNEKPLRGWRRYLCCFRPPKRQVRIGVCFFGILLCLLSSI
jgi:hypothetical protein